MDTVTHALSGALLALATAPGSAPPGGLSRRARIAAGAAAAAFPDSDFVLRAVDTLTYLNLHQGVTHSLILLPLWAQLLAVLFTAFSRRRYRWTAFYGVAALGIAIHIGGDVITAYGTQLLAPFSGARFSWPVLFVIDPVVTALLVAGLSIGMLWPQRRLAPFALVVLAGYIGLAAVQHERALRVGGDHAQARNLDGAVSHALPQPLSPFHWLVIVEHGDRYHTARINLGRDRDGDRRRAAGFLGRLANGYAPPAQATWARHSRYGAEPLESAQVRAAIGHASFTPFRRFARFLVLDHVEARENGQCLWFTDLRFSLPELPPSFRYGLCRTGPQDAWHLSRLRGAFHID
jgi:inner membrane protein